MKRASLPLLLGLLFAVVALIAWRLDAPAADPQALTAPWDARGATPTESAAAVSAPTTSAPDPDDMQRTQAPAAVPTVQAEAPFRFRILDGRSDAPIAGAQVHWLDHAQKPVWDPAWKDPSEEPRSLNVDPAAFRAKALRSNQVTLSDHDGRVVLPLEPTWITAQRGNLIGGTESLVDSATGFIMRLWPDENLRVQVIDAAGKPVPGIDVILVETQTFSGESWHRARTGALTDANGLATLRHGFAIAEGQRSQYPELKPTYRVEAAGFPAFTAYQAVDPGTPTPVPFTLQLPAWGEVQVSIVDPDGQPTASDLELALLEEDFPISPAEPSRGRTLLLGPARAPGRLNAAVVNGAALFQHVGLGQQLIAVTARNRASLVHIRPVAGPTLAGERVQITLILGAEAVLLRGRAVDWSGKPLASVRLHTILFSGKTPTRGDLPYGSVEDLFECLRSSLTTDEDGRFSIEFSKNAAFGGQPLLVLACPRPRSYTLETRLDLSEVWQVGVQSLGDVPLALPPVLAAGRVVDSLGMPLSGATVEIRSSRDPSAGFSTETNLRGDFEMRSARPYSEVRLDIRKDGYLPESPDASAPKRADCQITLTAAYTIRGRIQVPIGSSAEDFMASVRLKAPTEESTHSDLSTVLEANGEFKFLTGSAGTYTLTVFAFDRSKVVPERSSVRDLGQSKVPLVLIENIVTTAGAIVDLGVIELGRGVR